MNNCFYVLSFYTTIELLSRRRRPRVRFVYCIAAYLYNINSIQQVSPNYSVYASNRRSLPGSPFRGRRG
jgi:hypothetical protein